jgi:putative ABC transport system permease protein
MNIFENFRIALRALTANKLRSGLTMLGIIIGVAAVVALMAVGKGATSGITSQVEGLGTNLISVSSGRFFQQPGVQAQSLLYSDYMAIEKAIGSLAEITPAYQTMANVINGDRQSDYTITGVQANFTAVNSYTVARGRFITEQDNTGQARVAVIGSQAAEDLYSSLNPVGREIQIDGITFKVVGVLESKGTSGFTSQDDIVLIPLETGYERLFGGRALSSGKRTLTGISLSAHDSAQTDNIISTVEYTLRREHGLTLRDDLGFVVSSQTQMLSTLSTITGTMTALLGAIAAISLLVGGIGIMNITLVSVRERTREIGLRKAVGARRNVILLQFLAETLTLSIMGGIAGILLGAGIAWIVSLTGVISTLITADTIILAFGSAVLVGLFFGIYPAYQAAGLRPIEALRYE